MYLDWSSVLYFAKFECQQTDLLLELGQIAFDICWLCPSFVFTSIFHPNPNFPSTFWPCTFVPNNTPSSAPFFCCQQVQPRPLPHSVVLPAESFLSLGSVGGINSLAAAREKPQSALALPAAVGNQIHGRKGRDEGRKGRLDSFCCLPPSLGPASFPLCRLNTARPFSLRWQFRPI
jgi:hypothetical protein